MIRAGAALAAALASFLSVFALCRWAGAHSGPAIVAAILAISLSRRASPTRGAYAATAPVAIACVALAAFGVGWLFHASRVLGAIAFTGGMFLSVWLRNYGETARSAGALVAMPLIAILVVPARPAAPGGPLVDFALVAGAGVISLAYVAAIQWLAQSAGFPLHPKEPAAPARERSSGRLSPATRMALQMAVALGAAFATSFLVFPEHWGWCVLTAFIVCSGARGRGDAAYKGVLRLAGALSGTLAAAAFARLWAPSGIAEAGAIFGVLFFGLWLRDLNYAYWAACMTLILAMLAGSSGELVGLLGARLEAILLGALCAVAAAWFVFPIRTEAVIRRRLADVLLALDDLIAHVHLGAPEHVQRLALFEHRLAEIERVAAPVRWHRRIFVSQDVPEHPARWIDFAAAFLAPVRALGPNGHTSETQRAAVRRAIGASRRAVANHGKPSAAGEGPPVSVALERVRDALAAAAEPRLS